MRGKLSEAGMTGGNTAGYFSQGLELAPSVVPSLEVLTE